MVVCSHDMIIFVYTNWEWITNDSHVFMDALSLERNHFSMPIGGEWVHIAFK